MHSFHKEKFLPNPASEIFKLVMDIEAYPKFVPWCERIIIISRSEEEIIAEMEINYKGFKERYKSSIITSKIDDNFIVKVKAISGPFKFLNNTWRISHLSEGCKVDFRIELEFKSFLLDKMIGLLFINAAEKMISAFEERAKLLNSKES